MPFPNGGNDALRPATLAEFGGQPIITRRLGVVLESAKQRGEMPDHLCFAGPPGLGKTSLAHIVAAELGAPLIATSGPAITKAGDIASMLTGITRPSVVFIDEIHQLPRVIEEYLYTPMEDRALELTIGAGDAARVVRLPLQPFTLVGATTQLGTLSSPLRDRFGYTGTLKPYPAQELTSIIVRSAGMLGLDITEEGAYAIALRSRGTPRVANRWLRRVRDCAQLEQHRQITEDVAERALAEFGVDELGLDELSREILTVLIDTFGGGPVGAKALAAAVGEAETTITNSQEPHLLRTKLLARTPRGRVATAAAYQHLGRTPSPRSVLAGENPNPEVDTAA